MSTGNINLDILLEEIEIDKLAGTNTSISQIIRRYPSLSRKEAEEIYKMVSTAFMKNSSMNASVVATLPPSFFVKAKSTKNTVEDLIRNAEQSILITGYSLSGYFEELLDVLIEKSQKGIYIKFFVNNVETQKCIDKLCRYKGNFLHIYDFLNSNDSMSALHAKVISVDQEKTLITSANLSYHGQEGNIELGTHIQSEQIANQVKDIFTQMVFKKIFVEC